MGNEEIHFQLFHWRTPPDTQYLPLIKAQIAGTKDIHSMWNIRLVWITEHINICIWTGHNNCSCEDELPLFQSWGAAPARWAGGAEGTPSAWDNFMCAMDTEEHTGTWRFPMSVTFMYPLCHSKETSLCSPPAFIFNLLLEKLKISGQEILPCLSTVTISMAWRAVEQCVQNKEKQLHLHYS